jgi:hypothetical protein
MSSPRPYLAFELDAKREVAGVARAAGIGPGDIAWGLLELWEACWRRKVEVVSEMTLAACFGPDQRIPLLLEEAGFLAKEDGGWRIRGAARYLRISKQRSDAGKARATGPRDSSGRLKPKPIAPGGASGPPADVQRNASGEPALPPNTDDRAPTIEEPPPAGPSAKVLQLHPVPPPKEDEELKVGKALEEASGQPFWAWLARQRSSRDLAAEKEPKAFQEWLWRALAKVGVSSLSGSYLRFLEDKDFAMRGWPIRVWMHENVWMVRAYDERRDEWK